MATIIGYLIFLNFTSGGLLFGSLNDEERVGNFNPFVIFPIHISIGLMIGGLEAVRRIIPRSIISDNVNKLKKLNAYGHVFYEISGTAGAFVSTLFLKYLGPIYALLHLPPCFFLSGIAILFLKDKLPEIRKMSTQP